MAERRRTPREDAPIPRGESPTDPGEQPDKDDYERPLPPKFVQRLEKAGLRVGKGGKILTRRTGIPKSPETLSLVQEAYERFGLSNQFFDPTRVAFSGEFDQGEGGKSPRYISLATGVYSTGQGVADDELLEVLRLRTGFDMENERNALVKAYEPYGVVPFAYQTAEGFARYQELARQNYLGQSGGVAPADQTAFAAEQRANLEKQLDVLDDGTLQGLTDASTRMLQSRQRKQRAQSLFTNDFYSQSELVGDEE